MQIDGNRAEFYAYGVLHAASLGTALLSQELCQLPKDILDDPLVTHALATVNAYRCVDCKTWTVMDCLQQCAQTCVCCCCLWSQFAHTVVHKVALRRQTATTICPDQLTSIEASSSALQRDLHTRHALSSM